MRQNSPARQDRHLEPNAELEAHPADPLSNPSPTPDLVRPDARPEPLPKEPPDVDPRCTPCWTPDHPLGPPEPIDRSIEGSIS